MKIGDQVSEGAAGAIAHLNEDHDDALLDMARAIGCLEATAARCMDADRTGLDLIAETPAGEVGHPAELDVAQLLEVLTGSLFDAPPYRNYGAMLAEKKYKPAGFAAPLGLKDMRLAGHAADALRVPMPLLGILRDHLLQTIAVDGEDIDWSAIGRAIDHNAGL